MSVCNKCGREESEENPFPNWTKTICKQCDAERKAAWYREKHGPIKEKRERMEIDRDAQICQDCGELFSYSRVKKFCGACIRRHEKQALEDQKPQKVEYDRLRMQEKRETTGFKRDEREKEYHREWMIGYRKRKKEEL